MSSIETTKSRLKKCIAIFIVLMCLIAIPMASMASGYVSPKGERMTRRRLSNELKQYSGVFSTAVNVSINPPATLAVLAIFGSIENAAAESNSVFLRDFADALDEIPVVREMRYTPVANPYAAAILSLMGIAWIVLNSNKVTAAISNHVKWFPIEKINLVGSNICYVGLSLLHLVTNDKIASITPGVKSGAIVIKTAVLVGKDTQVGSNDPLTYVLSIATGVTTVFFGNCVYFCVKNWESIVTAAPMKGTNLFWQIAKVILHSLLLVLQMFAPIVSVIIAIHLAVASVFLFRFLKRTAQYYTDIYIFTILRRIFQRNKPVPRIEKRVPRRLKKLYPSMEIGMAVYTFHGYARLAKRSRVWLIKEGDKVDLIYKRLIRKPYIVTWADFREKHENRSVYLEQCIRFLRIRTEDKKVELIMSNRYKPEAEMLSDLLDLKDYEIVKQENKETKRLQRQERKMRRKRKKQEVEAT